jgi:hypothetical protein
MATFIPQTIRRQIQDYLEEDADAPDAKLGDAEADSIDTGEARVGPNARQWGDRLDFWIVGGQSNAQGSEYDPTTTVDVTEDVAIQYDFENSTIKRPLDDPFVESEDQGSAWTAFAQRYYELTGVKSAYGNASFDGTAQNATADSGAGNWDSSGDLRSQLVSRVQTAKTAFEAQGYDVRFRGILWCQGERDAQAMDDGGTITKSDYKTALQDMLAYYDSQFSEPWNLHIFEIGHREGGDTAGFQAVRKAQREVCRSNEHAKYASGQQKYFPERGLMINTFHWGTDGLTVMGQTGAERVAGAEADPGLQGTVVHRGGSNQTIPNNSRTVVQYDSVTDDDFDQADTSNGTVVVEGDGKRHISACVNWDSSMPDGTSIRIIIRVNGSVADGASKWITTGATDFNTISTNRRFDLDDGDEVDVAVNQQSGGAADILSGSHLTYLSVTPTTETTA